MASISQHTHANGLDYIAITTPLCDARIFLQGAQIDQFTPKDKAALLWVSSADEYLPGSGIRGGIPICWPWFGAHSNPDWPQHGFARTRLWQLDQSRIENDIAYLTFSLTVNEQDKQYWPHQSQVSIEFVLSEKLQVSLITTNTGSETFEFTQALHSYFPIGDIHQLVAHGFAGSKYIEFGQGPYLQEGDSVRFDRETDRVYTQLADRQLLETPNGVIEVMRDNSRSAVLWNPWIDKSKWLARFNDEDYLTMVCLEAANVLEDKVQLAPNQSQRLTTTIGWR